MINKLAAIVLGLALAACNPAPDPHAGMAETGRMGVHGMALLGDREILLNHMALYRAPHDRQILMRAHIIDDAQRADWLAWRADHPGLVSIVPEAFDLDRLAPGAETPLTQITADIYEGHFERGGTVVFASVVFELGTPLLHQAVVAEVDNDEWITRRPGETAEEMLADSTHPSWTYIELDETAFLVRDIGPQPGVDMILNTSPRDDTEPGTRIPGDLVLESPDLIAYRETLDFQ